MSRLSLMFMTK